jgi:predicted DNA-binding WGR domain protein
VSARRFELVEGSSSKFWEVEPSGTTLSVRWGRIGTAGQSQEKAYPSEAAAEDALAKLVAEKTKKGYVEVESVTRSSSSSTSSTSSSRAAVTPVTAGVAVSHVDSGMIATLRGNLEPAALARAIEAIPGSAFLDPLAADALIAALADHRALHGVTEAHRAASETVRPHLSLLHPFAHESAITAAAISPSGRWLATGSGYVDTDGDWDAAYERGGLVCVWDVLAGRCVNVLGRVKGGVGGAEGTPRALEWHQSEAALAASTGTHGVARLAPFAADGGVRCVTTQGDGFDGIAPAWCWIPGGDELALATFIVRMGDEDRQAKLRKHIDAEECGFRSRVCAYDGVVTDGHYTVRADTLERIEPRPFRDPRMGLALDGLAIDAERRVRFTSPRGDEVVLDVIVRRHDHESPFVPVASSPDGRELATLTEEGRVVRFSCEGQRLSELEATWAHGVALGAGVLVLIAPHRIAFVEIATQEVLGDFAQGEEVSPHPLGADEAAIRKSFRYDPAFAIAGGWAVALPTGEVAAPLTVHAALGGALALALGGRRSWPLDWVKGASAAPKLAVAVGDLAAALPAALRRSVTKSAAAKKPGKRSAPELTVSPATIADVLDEAARIVAAVPAQWKASERAQLAAVEAAAGRGPRAVSLFDEARAAERPSWFAVDMAVAATRLAGRHGADAVESVRALVARVRDIPGEEYSERTRRAAALVNIAEACDRIGDETLAETLLEEALALAPAWSTPPVGAHPPSVGEADHAVVAVRLLLARGQRERALAVIGALGAPFAIAPLFSEAAARGDRELAMHIARTHRDVSGSHVAAATAALEARHLDLFDELYAPMSTSRYIDGASLGWLSMKRALDGLLPRGDREPDRAAIVARIDETLAIWSTPAPPGTFPAPADALLLAATVALEACLDAGLDDLAKRLGETIASMPLPPLRVERFYWGAAAAVARAGLDVSPMLAQAAALDARLRGIAALLEAGGPARAVALAAAPGIDLAKVTDPIGEVAARAGRVLAAAGETERGRALIEAASRAAGSDRFTLGAVAREQLRAGDHEGAWASVQRVKKSDRINAVAELASAAAQLDLPGVVAAIIRAAGAEHPMIVLYGARQLIRDAS